MIASTCMHAALSMMRLRLHAKGSS
uniref:Uncharacterized protein n=1 Tax=Amphimedon queenslandica TaxID=400682 RepID=A0A1X7TI56_AMPQE